MMREKGSKKTLGSKMKVLRTDLDEKRMKEEIRIEDREREERKPY